MIGNPRFLVLAAGRGSRVLRSAVLAMVALSMLLLPAASASVPAAPLAAACVYKAVFVADVTIPDNTVIPASQSFAKVWRVRNTGNCSWGPGTEVDALAFAGGSQLGAPNIVPLTAEIRPGTVGDVSVTLTAPAASGTYRSEWKFRKTSGATFGVGGGNTALYVKFIVRAGGPSPTPEAQRIQFAAGSTVSSVQGSVTFPQRKGYLLRARGGQVMTIAVVSANNVANFSVEGVTDGIPYKRLENEDRYYTFVLPSEQDYLVKVATPAGTASYVLAVAIAP